MAETLPAPRSAAAALELILARKDPGLRVSAVPDAGRRSLRYTASAPGQLYLMGMREGSGEPLVLLAPAIGAAPARIGTAGKVDLPAARLKPGRWRFAFVVTREPVDPAAFGWVAADGLWTWRFTESAGPGAGARLPWAIPACAPGAAPCIAAYGADAFDMRIDAAAAVEAPKPAAAGPGGPHRKGSQAVTPAPAPGGTEDKPPKSAKAAPNPECEKILTRLSLGETSQDLIDRMKTLKCN
jgi:hypothetical protein